MKAEGAVPRSYEHGRPSEQVAPLPELGPVVGRTVGGLDDRLLPSWVHGPVIGMQRRLGPNGPVFRLGRQCAAASGGAHVGGDGSTTLPSPLTQGASGIRISSRLRM